MTGGGDSSTEFLDSDGALDESPSGLAAGTLVTPNIRLARPLGQGGMGAVWLADQLTLDTQVAVKFIMSERSSSAALRQRFQREAKVAAQLKSPHVVQMFDFGTMEDETPFIVMELLDGESLGDRLERAGPMSLGEVAQLVSQVAEVFAMAHEQGIIHRDIKPDNLFLIASKKSVFVKVLDFGIAKQTRLPTEMEMTTTGAMVGTPFYMSPELIESAKTATEHADMWALAIVAYQALTGELPFTGETLGGLCIAINKGRFVPVSKANPALPDVVNAWFTRALDVEQENRFSSASEMATAFSKLVTNVDEMCAASTDPVPEAAPPTSASPTSADKSKVASLDMTTPLDLDDGVEAATQLPRTFSGASKTLDSTSPPRDRPSSSLPAVLMAALVVAIAAIVVVVRVTGTESTASSPTERAAPADTTLPTPPPETVESSVASAVATEPTPAPSVATSSTAKPAASTPVVPRKPVARPPKPAGAEKSCLRYDDQKKKWIVIPACNKGAPQ